MQNKETKKPENEWFCITENTQTFFLLSSLNLTLVYILLRNMRLLNFILSSMLSFADKPKLPYLTRPIKNKKKTRKLSAKIDTNSNLTFESKMNLKSISVCTKSIKITAILVTFLRWLQYSWILYNYLSFSVRKSSLDHIKAERSMKSTFQTCGLKAFVY